MKLYPGDDAVPWIPVSVTRVSSGIFLYRSLLAINLLTSPVLLWPVYLRRCIYGGVSSASLWISDQSVSPCISVGVHFSGPLCRIFKFYKIQRSPITTFNFYRSMWYPSSYLTSYSKTQTNLSTLLHTHPQLLCSWNTQAFSSIYCITKTGSKLSWRVEFV